MTSWVNPSKAVTDLLSHFLNFDKEQLKLGIWAGNLSIRDVNLKQEAFYPLLNPIVRLNDSVRPPLCLKLVEGSVGHMRFKIPWKRLVWGQGDVQLVVSDVNIVLAYETRQETGARIRNSGQGNSEDTLGEISVDADDSVGHITRDIKQEWLRQAERAQLQGLPIPPKPAVESSSNTGGIENDGGSESHKVGRLERLLKSATSSFMWRFFAGMKSTIRNVRIVIVQDGIELGAITHSIELAPKSENKLGEATNAETVLPDSSEDESTGISGDRSIPPPPEFIPRGEYDDGEHVNKTLSVHGMGIFVRQEATAAPELPALRFSSSVSADDFLLRPTELSVVFSLFYPYPAKKRKSDRSVHKVDLRVGDSVVDSITTTSSRRRRSKRDKSHLPETENMTEATTLDTSEAIASAMPKRPNKVTRSTSTKSHRSRRSSVMSRPSTLAEPDSRVHHRRSTGLSEVLSLLPLDELETEATDKTRSSIVTPHIAFQLTLFELKMVCSSRHYLLAHEFASSVTRTRNGRPKRRISSFLSERDGADMRNAVVVEAPVSAVQHIQAPYEGKVTPSIPRPDPDLKRSFTVDGAPTASTSKPSSRRTLELRLQLTNRKRTERSDVTRQWWQYAYDAILFDIRVRKRNKNMFEGGVAFSWDKQRHHREEYVNMYISTHLEASSVFNISRRVNEVALSEIEDELPVEQILLYRAIARSLRVRGIRKMPRTLVGLHGETFYGHSEKAHDAMRVVGDSLDGLIEKDQTTSRVAGERYADMAGALGDGPVTLAGIRSSADRARRRRVRGSLDGEVSGRNCATGQLGMNAPLERDIQCSLLDRAQEKEMPPSANGPHRKKRTSFVLPSAIPMTVESSRAAPEIAETVHAAKSVASFKTSRTSTSKRTSSTDARPESTTAGGTLRYSVSIKISSLHLLVFRNKMDPNVFDHSVSSQSGASGGKVAHLAGFLADHTPELNIMERWTGSNASEISNLSDDDVFFEGEANLVRDEEEAGDRPILSSTDFLLFGVPDDIILEFIVTPISCQLSGRSGMPLNLSIEIGFIALNGQGKCHLLSLGSSEMRKPVEEVDIHRRAPRLRRGSSVTVRQRAVDLSLSTFEGRTNLLCDLSSLRARGEMQALVAVGHFFDATNTIYPSETITVSPRDQLRQFVLGYTNAPATMSDKIWNTAVCLHGAELLIPFTGSGDAKVRSSEGETISTASGPHDAVRLTLDSIDFYSNALAAHIISMSAPSVDDRSRSTRFRLDVAEALFESRDWNLLSMLRFDAFASHETSIPASDCSIVALSGLNCDVHAKGDDVSGRPMRLLDFPVNIESMLLQQTGFQIGSSEPMNQLRIEISSVHLVLSNLRVSALVHLLHDMKISLSNGTRESGLVDLDALPVVLARLDALSDLIVFTLAGSISDVQVAVIDDTAYGIHEATVAMRQIVMEECLSNYLAVLSSFGIEGDLGVGAQPIACQLCVDRLITIGFSRPDALECIEAARLGFTSQTILMGNSSDDGMDTGVNSPGCSTFPNDKAHAHCSANSLPSDLMTAENDESISGFSTGESSDSSFSDVETSLKRVIASTVSAFSDVFLDLSAGVTSFRDNLVVSIPGGVQISVVRAFYDYQIESQISAAEIRNGAGIKIAEVRLPEGHNIDIEEDEVDARSFKNSILSQPGRASVLFTITELDKQFQFAAGGGPLSILASDVEIEDARDRQRLCDVTMERFEVTFSQHIWSEAISILMKLGLPVSSSVDQTFESDRMVDQRREQTSPPHIQTSFSADAHCGSLVLLTDDLLPFTRVMAKNISVENTSSASAASGTTFSAKSFTLTDMTPNGRVHPHVLGPIAQEGPALKIYYDSRSNPWKDWSECLVELCDMRMVVTQRYLAEMMQYLSSDDHGIGMLRSTLRDNKQPLVDANGNPMPPLRLRLSILNSSFIIPRNSSSMDLVAAEIDQLLISTGYCDRTFEMPSEDSPLFLSPDVRSDVNLQNARQGSSSSDSETEFFDCINLENAAPLSSFDKNLISQLRVEIRSMRLLTSLDPTFAAPQEKHSHPCLVNGRADGGKSVYLASSFESNKPRDDDVSIPLGGRLPQEREAALLARRWGELTGEPLSLLVVLENPQHRRRVLVTDQIALGDNRPIISGIDLKMHMSQYCLLLSVYYSNMKELPSMFPYSPSQIVYSAKAPSAPTDCPVYGTSEYVSWLKNENSEFVSEIACVLNSVSFRCLFDRAGYFDRDPPSSFWLAGSSDPSTKESLGVQIKMNDIALHYATDRCGIMRTAMGASMFTVVDERYADDFQAALTMRPRSTDQMDTCRHERVVALSTFADLSWGLDCDVDTFKGQLPQRFQASIFIAQGWLLANLGFDGADMILKNLSPVFILSDYFGCYFKDEAYGYPLFAAEKYAEDLKNDLNDHENGQEPLKRDFGDASDSLKLDLRLWMLRPSLCIPGDDTATLTPCLHVTSRSGFWYRYRSVDDFSSQEICSTDLSMNCTTDVHPSLLNGGDDLTDDAERSTLIDGLSFGLRVDSSTLSPHTDVIFRIPFLEGPSYESKLYCSIEAPELEVKPIVLQPPTVCVPVETPRRTSLGPSVCELTLLVELFPLVSSRLVGFTSISRADESPGVADSSRERAGCAPDGAAFVPEDSFSVVAHLGSLRLFATDPILGSHLPISVLSIASLDVSASRLGSLERRLKVRSGDSPPEDMQVLVDTVIWADYFKLGMTRSWEPLLEPFHCLVMHENSIRRGRGFTLSTETDFHVNITGVLVLTFEEVVASFSRSITEAFRMESTDHSSYLNTEGPQATVLLTRGVEERRHGAYGEDIVVKHQLPKWNKDEERVAFTFRNLTGQRIRLHQMATKTEVVGELRASLTYLDHLESTSLSFDATISVMRNLEVVDVAYPGLPNTRRETKKVDLTSHAIDVQLPGFKWLQRISVDTSGRRFDGLHPRNISVQDKARQDWRLENALKVLTEIGLENGGRLVTIRSLFEIRNRTSHQIDLAFHPDPRHRPATTGPDGASTVTTDVLTRQLEKDGVFQIPILLVESALQLDGNHLGSFWLRPEGSEDNVDLAEALVQRETVEGRGDSPNIGYCSRPLQLAKMVNESADLFENNRFEDVSSEKARSGIQVSCPLSDDEGEASVAPFCYVVEIRRSPIVPQTRTQSKGLPLLADGQESSMRSRESIQEGPKTHGPVSYSLFIHPPLVIENLLPKSGRFELMHAARRTVLWFADLKPGERVPVHTVGLDAPLLLLVNLGFCRTPVGDGALVHHGSDSGVRKATSSPAQAGLKSIGKAVSKGKKQLGKTFTQITESPDRRALDRLAIVRGGPFLSGKKRTRNAAKTDASYTALGMDSGAGVTGSDGRVHAMEYQAFSPSDCVSEMTVVDGIGQKLSLKIENMRGGGGQRHITLYCPFWIVNTTEHALSYKQEKGLSFVSGTVISPELDGSGLVDGSNRNYVGRGRRLTPRRRILKSRKRAESSPSGPRRKSIFAGTPGALATSSGQCKLAPAELASWIDKDLCMDKLVSTAFMFNFHEEALSIGEQRLSVRLSDGTGQSPYSSDWSKGFSVDSVGVNQIVSMHCKEGRSLEVSVTFSVAPGFLSAYTKIVRFTPRFVLVNNIDQPIRLWQDSSLLHAAYGIGTPSGTGIERREQVKWQFKRDASRTTEPLVINQYETLFGRSVSIDESTIEGMPRVTTADRRALYIATIRKSELFPFHLPDSRGDRELRVDLGGSWNLTPSFSADAIGEYTFHLVRSLDLRLLDHVTTRASPQYTIALPPPEDEGTHQWEGELGVWFETDWGGERRIIVKGTKRGEYAFNHTDIHVGDELLRIDEMLVSQMTFQDTMKLLRDKLTYISLSRNQRDTRRQRGSIIQRFQRRSTISGPPDLSRLVHSLGGSQSTSVVLTFRTHEERLRRVRAKASRTPRRNSGMRPFGRNAQSRGGGNDRSHATEESSSLPELHRDLKVDMRVLHNSVIVDVQAQDIHNPPYRVENRAVNHIIFYRQRGCSGHAWTRLKPGESRSYSWEEPLRPRRLTVRVGFVGVFFDSCSHGNTQDGGLQARTEELARSEAEKSKTEAEKKAARAARARRLLSLQYVENEEQGGLGPSRTIKLEEIGYTDLLPLPAAGNRIIERPKDEFLTCKVDADGATRVLVVSDNNSGDDEGVVMQNHLASLKQRIGEEQRLKEHLLSLKAFIRQDVPSQTGPLASVSEEIEPGETRTATHESSVRRDDSDELADNTVDMDILEERATNLVHFPEDRSIVRRHQLVVEVLEAAGLRSPNVSGLCNPYCEIALKQRARTRRDTLGRRVDNRKTYFVEKTICPKWIQQAFVFDVPPEAVQITRGHLLQIKVRSFRLLGQHSHLGKTTVHLRSLRNQQALVGWYPLLGRTGRRDIGSSVDDLGRGSLKISVQWVYTVPALVDYFLMLSEKMLSDLEQSRDGMKRQHDNFIATETKRRAHLDVVSSVRIPDILNRLKSTHEKHLWNEYFEPADRKKMKRHRGSLVPPHDDVGMPHLRVDTKTSEQSPSKGTKSNGGRVVSKGPPATARHRQRLDSDFEQLLLRRRQLRTLSLDASVAALPVTPHETASGSARRLDFVATDEGQPSSVLYLEETSPSDVEQYRKDVIADLAERGFLYSSNGTNRHLVVGRGTPPWKRLNMRRHILHFPTWTAAQAVLNDKGLNISMEVSHVSVSLSGRGFDAAVRSKALAKHRQQVLSVAPILLPVCAPEPMMSRAYAQAERLAKSRRQFERACTRSLGAVLNPGGWLTIRPVTALNLPDTYSGMHVKLRYGSEVACTETVDAKVTPIWSDASGLHERAVSVDETASPAGGSPAIVGDRFVLLENDLQVYVEPQKTSGSLRISVMGERMNSKVELGVLHIPIGAAIGCCVEMIEESLEGPNAGHTPSLSGTPMYVRWFPLKNPKDAVPVEGDLGLSARPVEIEKKQDNMFHQYFMPCIKLALFWHPAESEFPTDERSDMPGVQQRRSGASSVYSQLISAVPDIVPEPLIVRYFNADFGKLSASLISSQKARELITMNLADTDMRYSVTKSKTRIGLVVGWIQIDHQNDSATEPVVLAPTAVEHPQPTLNCLAVKDNLRSKSNIDSYEYIGISLQEMDLTLEQTWIRDLWDFSIGVVRRSEVRKKTLERGFDYFTSGESRKRVYPRGNLLEEGSVPAPSLLLQLTGSTPEEPLSRKVYVEKLLLGFVKVNVSYFKGKKESTLGKKAFEEDVTLAAGGLIIGRSGEARESSVFDAWSENTHEEDFWREGQETKNLPSAIAAVFPSVSDAPIRIPGKAIDHVFESPAQILGSIRNYYMSETLKQIYKIIGSLDFVGNPTMLINSVASGVRDFFFIPSRAFLRTPMDPSRVGLGVAKGTLSLFSNSFSGIFGFMSKVSASVGQASAFLSFDPDFVRWHRETVLAESKNLNREWKRRGVQSAGEIIGRPLYDIFRGFALGTTGLFLSPYLFTKKEGPMGLAKGTVVGVAGLFTKPLSGIFDSVAHVTGSLHHVAKSANVTAKRQQPAKKLRLRHSFGLMSVLLPFEPVAARSSQLLRMHPAASKLSKSGRSKSELREMLLASELLNMEPGVDTFAVVTNRRIVLFRVRKDSNGSLISSLCWEVDLTRGASISSRLQDQGHNGVGLVVSTRLARNKVIAFDLTQNLQSSKRDSTTPLKTPRFTTVSIEPESLPSSSLYHDAVSRPSMLALGDANEVDADIGPMLTQVWEESLVKKPSEAGGEIEASPTLYGSTQGKQGDELEWFLVLAEFQQRRQLLHIHNAICCVTGDLESIVDERHYALDLGTEGYTSFGQFEFGRFETHTSTDIELRRKAISDSLDCLPWAHRSMFQLEDRTPEEQVPWLEEMRKEWILSRAIKASEEEGGPSWLVRARASAMFVPMEPPELPKAADSNDQVVATILNELEQGNISWNQACELLATHTETLQKENDKYISENSSLSQEGRTYDADDHGHDQDVFETARFESLSSDLLASRPTLKRNASMSDMHVRTSSLKPELGLISPEENITTSLDALDLECGSSSNLLNYLSAEQQGLVREEGSVSNVDSIASPKQRINEERSRFDHMAAEMSPPNDGAAVDQRSRIRPDPSGLDVRLDRLEVMLEQLLAINRRQQALPRQERAQIEDDPTISALRLEIEELRAAVQSAVTRNDREQIVMALREEVQSLKTQLQQRREEQDHEARNEENEGDDQFRWVSAQNIRPQRNEGSNASVFSPSAETRAPDSITEEEEPQETEVWPDAANEYF